MDAYLIVDTLLNDANLYEEYKANARPVGREVLTRVHRCHWG
jgi:uncharacterized protein (DUF1330 family)